MTDKPMSYEPLTLEQVEYALAHNEKWGYPTDTLRQLIDTMREVERLRARLVGVDGSDAINRLYVVDLEKENGRLWAFIKKLAQNDISMGRGRVMAREMAREMLAKEGESDGK